MNTIAPLSGKAATIRTKITVLLLVAGILPLLVLSTVTFFYTRALLHDQSRNQLVALRELKRQQIEAYFRNVRREMDTTADDLMVVNAVQQLAKAFFHGQHDLGDRFRKDEQQYLSRLHQRYRYQVEHTPGATPAVEAAWFPSDPNSIIWQSRYIAENPNPVGHKMRMDDARDGSEYSRWHALFNPVLKRHLEDFGYYDIFLIEPSKLTIVYTVDKEVDYATSLMDGPYRDTNLATVVRQAMKLGPNDHALLIDFARYAPSFNLPAAFAAEPIYDGKRLVGVLAYQLPIDRINQIVTDDRNWERMGLGHTGDIYLIGPDFTFRNDTRALVEGKDAYLANLKALGTDPTVIEEIRRGDTTILTLMARTRGTEAAIAGQTGFLEYMDKGMRMLGAYSPLTIPGLHWGIVVRTHAEEAYAAANKLAVILLLCVVVIATLAFLGGMIMIRTIVRPIRTVADELHELAEGEADLTRRIPVETNDELGTLASNFNHFMDNMLNLVRQVQRSGIQVTSSSTQISASARQLEATATEQAASTNEIVATAREISATSLHLVSTMDEVSSMSEQTTREAGSGRQGLDRMRSAMSQMAQASQSISGRLATINEKAANITTIITTITKVADQTNLLSLNAAIEAEKAGEFGLGFAVVAREIRRLADQTAVATLDIEQMVKEMQSSVSTGVMEMDKFAEEVRRAVEDVGHIAGQLQAIVEQVQALTPRFESVNEGMQSQAEAAQQISEAIGQVSQGAGQTAEGLREFSKVTMQLKDAAGGLQSEVARFHL